MLKLRVRSPPRSPGFATRLGQSPNDGQRLFMQTVATAPTSIEGARKPTSILSRMSDRKQSRTPRNSVAEQQSPDPRAEAATATYKKPRPQARATSFVSSRSAQKRDHAAEKWFTDVRQVDIGNVNRPNGLESQPRTKRAVFDSPRQHEMRPSTDLKVLFASTPTRSALSFRLQAKKELGGDYASYLPEGLADPYRLPIDYARLVLGRNKHISLDAQTGALNLIEESIRGRSTRQVV